MIQRESAKLINKLCKTYPVVAVTGPRQSGKTTLTKALFKNKKYVSLEDRDTLAFAKEDPRYFLSQSKTGLLIDEIQNLPELFSYIQGQVDQKYKPGHFVITGSQQFNLVSSISQSLAGRTALVELLPFSLSELKGKVKNLNKTLYKGLYPPIYDKKFQPDLWYEDYVKTYIERDVRSLINIKNLSSFQTFLSLCAGRVGQLINYSELGNIAGLDTKTVRSWLTILSASYIIFFLKPHYKNFSKRLVKSTKLYFYDPGLLCWLLRLRKEDLSISPYKGVLFESLIISEALKHNKNYKKNLDFYFWRDNKGVEIDLLYQKGSKIISTEIKAGHTVHTKFFANLKKYQKYATKEHGKSFLIYGGEQEQKRQYGFLTSWKNTTKLFQ